MPFVVPGADLPRAHTLAAQLGVRPLTAQLLLNRGITDVAKARRFLDPRLSQLRAPEEDSAAMAGFARSAERLSQAVLGGETIGIFGDYDVDGVTTCALLCRFLRDAGARVLPRVASRAAGYGFGIEVASYFADEGCTLVVTGDCGTSDHDALAVARARCVDVIIVDHHQVPDREPDAYSLLNPHQASCRFPFKGLASVGVAFYLAAAVRTRLRAQGRELPDARELLDLVALGTIADMVPLTDENRVLVAAGLRELARGLRPGVRALLEVGGVPSDRPMTTQDVGFKLGPLLNAPGRLGEARLALDLLLEENSTRARAAADECQALNLTRREVQEVAFGAACAQIDALGGSAGGAPRYVTVAAGDGWHHGVVGIVAAKLVERYNRPTLTIALQGDEGRGSGRVPPNSGYHLVQALAACSAHLVRFGGHAAAAGLTIKRDRLADFTRAFDAAIEDQRSRATASEGMPADAEVRLDEVDERLVEELARLGPFGMGNPEPLLVVRGAEVDRTRIVGQKHLQMTLRQGARSIDGIAFNLASRDPGTGARVEAVFVPEVDTFRGARRLRLRFRDFSRAS